MFKKLRNKMLLINMILLTFVMLASFSAIYSITYSNVQSENQKKLEATPSFTTVSEAAAVQGSGGRLTVSAGISVEYAPSFILKVGEDGGLAEIISYLDLPEEAYREAFEKSWAGTESGGKLTLEGRTWQYATMKGEMLTQDQGRVFHQEYWQIVFLDITDSDAQLTRLLVTFILAGIGMMAAFFAISLWFSNRAIRPLEQSWQKQRQFVADASHELKTPIAIIGANIDAMEASGEETVNSQREWLSYIRAELVRMGGLVSGMLYLAKSEDVRPEEIMPFDLSVACETAIVSMEAMIYDKNIKLHTEIEKNVSVKGNRERVKQAILILLDNASKYTNDQGEIDATLHTTKGNAVFSVKNTGKGIPPEELPRIFDRFYRPDASRSDESGGYGLGLSIAKTIVEQAGGDISARSMPGLTVFTIILKLA